jgi:hypothetical protein
MADWVDSLSDAEVSALYKYKQGGADSLSDDEVKLMYPHKDKLTAPAANFAAIPDSTPMQGSGPVAEPSWMEKINAGVEAGVNTAAGLLGSATTGPLAAARTAIGTGVREGRLATPKELESSFNEGVGIFTNPLESRTTELGKEYTGKVGNVMNELLPMAPLHGTMPSLSVGQGVNALRSKFSKGGETGSAASRMAADLTKPTEAPVAPTEPLVNTRPSEQLSQEAYAQALREQELQKQSAFNRIGDEGEINPALEGLAKESPMERMTRDLGAEPGKVEVPQGPMESFYNRLTKDEGSGKTQAAQDIIVERSKDHNVRADYLAKVAEEQKAADLARARNMDSTPSPDHQAHVKRVAEEDAHRAQLEETHAHALEEQASLEAAQKAVEARQKTIDDAMSGVKSQHEGIRALTAEGAPKNDMLKAEADLRRRQSEAPAKSRKQLAIEAKAELAAEKARIVHQRAENEHMIQELRDQHTESEIRTRQAQADAQEAIAKRNQSNTAETTKAAQESAKLRAEADALAKDKAKRDTALANIAKQHALQEINLPAGSKERAAAVKAVNTKFSGKTGGSSKKSQGGKLLLNWGTKQKAAAFSNIPGLKDVLRDIGNAMIKSPAEAVALAGKFNDVSQNALQKGINLLTKGGTYLKGKVDNPVVHFTVDRFLTADSKAKAEISQKLHNEYLTSLRNLSKEEYQDAFTLLNAADLTQKEITPAMMQQYGLSTALQDFITTHQNAMADVMGKINAARVSVGKKPISSRAAYSAMNMSGDYRKVAYKTVNGQKVVVGVIGADRKAGKLGWTLEKIEKGMLAKDPTLEFGPLKDTTARTGSTKGTPHEAFQDALDTIGQNNPNVQAFLDTLREVAKDDPSNYMGMQTHTMQKKGVWGMEGRKPWMTEKQNATQFFENQTKYMEGAYNWSHLAEAAKDVNEVLRDGSVAAKHENAIKMSEAYMQNALGLNPSRVGRAIDEVVNSIGNATGIGPSNIRGFLGGAKAFANTSMLSLNPSFLAIQLIQGPAALPAMTALLRGRGLAPKSTMLTGGLDYITSAGITLLKDQSKLTPVERGALDYAKDNHVYAADMVEHSNTTTKGAMYYTNWATQHPAALIEQATRAQVYMSFVKMMDDSGLKPKDGLYEQAHRLTDQTMNNYGAMEKPAIYNALGPIGSMAYNLKSFGHNEISRWSMLAREIPATGNAVPLLTQMASTIAIAGVMGLPFYTQWESIYDTITSKLGEPRNLSLDVMEASEKLSKALGDDAGKFKDVMSHGAPTMLGMDVSKRVGLGDVLPNKASDVAFAGGSKLGGMVTSAASAAIHPDEPHLKAAAINFAPPIAQGFMKDAWYTDGDMALSMDPAKATKATAELNATDHLLKKLGITGINESKQKERNFQLGKLDKTYQDKRDTAVAGLTFALAHGGDLDPYMQKYLDNQGDPDSLVATVNGAIESIKIDPNKLAIIKDAASKSITRALSLQRRMEHQ